MKSLLCCFLLLQVPVINGSKLVKSPTGGRDAGVEFVKQAQTSLKSGDLGGFITAVGTVCTYIRGPTGVVLMASFATLGMAITAFSTNKKPPVTPFLKKLQDKLVKLDEIQATIKRIDDEFDANLRNHKLRLTRQSIVMLQNYWKKTSKGNNAIHKRNFIDKCKKENYDLLPRFFSNELARKDANSGLAQRYIADCDRRKYLHFAAATVLHFTEAANIQRDCTIAYFENHPDLNKTLAFYQEQNAQLLSEMETAMKNANQTFDRNVFDHVKHFVVDYIQQHSSKNVQELHNAIYGTLKSKYYWRNWMLMIRDAPYKTNQTLSDNVPDPKHPNYYRALNVAGKTIVLFSPEKKNIGSTYCPGYFNYCTVHLWLKGCDIAVEVMKMCVDRKIITGFGCIAAADDSKVVAATNFNHSGVVYEKCAIDRLNLDPLDHRRYIALALHRTYYVYWIN